jgi:glucose/mannose-6-phosphate isomerase
VINLDDRASVQRIDRHNMLELIESFPEQCSKARDIGAAFKVPSGLKRRYKNIVVTGLGGSAIGADILRSYAAGELKIPFFVNRNYTLPGFVDKDTLVIVSSYSGNTEETISSYKDAKSRKAKIVVITSGGKLQILAAMHSNPVIKIPGGLPPRCALGYSFFPLLVLLSKLGIVGNKAKKIDEVISLLVNIRQTRTGQEIPSGNNISKRIAKELYGKYPVIYGGQDHIDAVATRWRGELAENAKTLSSGHLFPEMCHNEIVGWDNPRKVLKDFTAIILKDAADHKRISKRMAIVKGIIEKLGIGVIEVNSCGKDLLSRIFSLIYIGDFVSYYLAILNGIDPTPVERIDYLKRELGKN